MKELITFLARGLVEHPEDVAVSMVKGETVTILELAVHDDDKARIIGQDGRVVQALRQILLQSPPCGSAGPAGR